MARRDPTELIVGLRALRERLIAEADLIAAFTVWEGEGEDGDEGDEEGGGGGRSLADLLVDRGMLDRGSVDRLSVGDRTVTHAGTEFGGSADVGSPSASAAAAAAIRYRVVGPHARGGLGEVFAAIDLELDRKVALKELQPRFARDASSQARFLREAEITGRLEHPGIVPVYGLGRHADGRPYYAMRFVEGETFRTAVDRFHRGADRDASPEGRELAFRRLLRSVVEACYAVGYAHSRGIVHRDLKPENIMVGRFGETLVVDWGLARDLGAGGGGGGGGGAAAGAPGRDESPFMTRPGSAVGTPAYMSPEQAAGDHDRIGPAADVYSLGATLYCLLVGAPPFAGASAAEVLERARSGVFPSPRRLRRSIDPALEAICLKAMALRPEDRHATTLEMAEALEAWLADVRYRDEQQSAMEQVRDSRARFAVERAASFLARDRPAEGMVWLARALEHGAPGLDRGLRLSLAAWHARDRLLERTLPLIGTAAALRFSPDGRRLAAVGGGGGKLVVLWDVASGTHLGDPLAHPRAVSEAAFSADGRTIATGCFDGAVRLWDGLSGRPVGGPIVLGGTILAVQAVGARFLAVSTGSAAWIDPEADAPEAIARPSSDRIASAAGAAVATESGDVWVLAADGEGEGRGWGWRARPRPHPLGAVRAAVHPGDGRLLVLCRDGVARLRADDAPTLEFADYEPTVWAAVCPSGATVATLSGTGGVQLWDAATGAALGEPLARRASPGVVVFHPEGGVLATACSDGSARLWDAASGLPLGPPLGPPGGGAPVSTLAFSPDGRRLAVAAADGRLRFWQTPAPLAGTVERIACWVRVTVDLDVDAADAVRPLDPLAGWELRRRLYELGGPPIK